MNITFSFPLFFFFCFNFYYYLFFLPHSSAFLLNTSKAILAMASSKLMVVGSSVGNGIVSFLPIFPLAYILDAIKSCIICIKGVRLSWFLFPILAARLCMKLDKNLDKNPLAGRLVGEFCSSPSLFLLVGMAITTTNKNAQIRVALNIFTPFFLKLLLPFSSWYFFCLFFNAQNSWIIILMFKLRCFNYLVIFFSTGRRPNQSSIFISMSSRDQQLKSLFIKMFFIYFCKIDKLSSSSVRNHSFLSFFFKTKTFCIILNKLKYKTICSSPFSLKTNRHYLDYKGIKWFNLLIVYK